MNAQKMFIFEPFCQILTIFDPFLASKSDILGSGSLLLPGGPGRERTCPGGANEVVLGARGETTEGGT